MGKFYRASTAEGKTWSFGFAKEPRRPAYWFATEGELEHTDTGFTVFKFTLFEARSRRQLLDGAATERRKKAALAKLLDSMRAEGLIKDVA